MDKLTSLSLFTALVGLLDSAYLAWLKLTYNEAACIGGFGDCYTVNTSPYAEVYGIPIALLGVLAYLTIAVIHLLEGRSDFFRSNGVLMVFGISLAGVLYSAYLTYLEVAVLRAWCPYCVLSAVAMTAIFVVSVIRLMRAPPEPA